MKRLFILALLVTACSPLPPLPPNPAKQLDSWRLNGRIAISAEKENWMAKVHWQQNGPTYQLRINTSFGQGAFMLEGSDDGVVMHTADNKTFTAPDPDSLVSEVLKVDLPITNLYFWIRGLPSDNSSPSWYTFNEAGHLHRLRQDGWELDYKRYTKVHGIDLPKKIFLENPQFKIKIVISQWDITNVKSQPKPLRVRY
ncbi:MAG TPA: outer membrane lipoprotein LolB [Thioploca sp.]|nr:MAG: outer membrane lipoprotein LolB [Gammaproteobacteria bacterium]HDN25742.1 outer membrane lipoprotein LolB [Thioploca sp.]